MNVCVRCGEPIDESEPGLRYYGPVTAHEPHRCIEVLRAKIAVLTASPAPTAGPLVRKTADADRADGNRRPCVGFYACSAGAEAVTNPGSRHG